MAVVLGAAVGLVMAGLVDAVAGEQNDPSSSKTSDSTRENAREGSSGDAGSTLRVDLGKSTIELDAVLVLPERNVEIFGCHMSGPNHETVVQFHAEGPAIYDAILAVGGRPPGFWNATAKDDMRRILGDRFVVLLRWEDERGSHELPAEKLFVESGTGFSAFVRGFAFGAEKVAMGDPPQLRIPRTVEITIGDPTRQGSVYSILFHPKDVRPLTSWLAPFDINPIILGNLGHLVQSETPCTLVLRRLDGEVELLELARSHAKEARRRELIDSSLLPIAREIDALKAEHVACIERIQEILDRSEGDGEEVDPEVQRQDGLELQEEMRRGRASVALIWERYLELFSRQESFKIDELRLKKGLDPELLERAVTSFEHGFKTELAIARVQFRQTLIANAYENDIATIELDRANFWRWQDAEQSRKRLVQMREEEGRDDCYLCQILKETVLKRESEVRRDRARKTILSSFSTEYRARVDGTWPEQKTKVLERRRRAKAVMSVAKLELERVRVLSDIRWTRNFLADADRDHKEIAELKDKLARLEGEESDLRAEIKAKDEALCSDPHEPDSSD